MNLLKYLTFFCCILCHPALAAEELDGHFSSWKDVPKLIDSITEDHYREPLDQLSKLTRIKLGSPQTFPFADKQDQKRYLLQTKGRWKQWWETSGKAVSIQKEQDAKVDEKAFQTAWDFLGTKHAKPKSILPVWIPAAWAMYVTFSNGDYMGRETELWVIDRQAESARLSKIRGDFSHGDWSVTLYEFNDFSPERADHILKAICYLNRYAPAKGTAVTENEMSRLYYPHATLHLRDDRNGILWNTEGYDFCKTRPEFGNGDGDTGRCYYFLKSTFAAREPWKEVSSPTTEQLAPYRTFLSFSKPYFSTSASDVVQLFGQCGGRLEKQAMSEWAEKQKAATNPKMDWTACAGDFGSQMKVNVINFTRSSIQNTQKEINKLGVRLEKNPPTAVDANGADKAHEKDLDRYVEQMQVTEKQEKEDAINRHPQPLRDLIKADEHPDDPDLKHLTAAIQAIRKKPDAKLFEQLVQELDEGTLSMQSLLKHILSNEDDLLKLDPWGEKEESIAINACIDALPLAKNGAKEDLIEILLKVSGGGKIEMKDGDETSSIEVLKTKDGYQMTFGGSADHPLSLQDAQAELRRIYQKSKSKTKNHLKIH